MKVTSVKEFLELCEEGSSTPYRVEAPIEVWRELIARYPEERETVAMNKTIPEEIIRELATSDDDRVRWTIATKRKTPPDVLAELAHDRYEVVRRRVALNPKVTREILLELVDDEWEPVRESAEERLREMEAESQPD